MEKYQDLQTHRIRDFTGNRIKMLRKTSCGTSLDENDGVSDSETVGKVPQIPMLIRKTN